MNGDSRRQRSGVKSRRGEPLGRTRSSGGFARRANFNDRETARSCCEPSRRLDAVERRWSWHVFAFLRFISVGDADGSAHLTPKRMQTSLGLAARAMDQANPSSAPTAQEFLARSASSSVVVEIDATVPLQWRVGPDQTERRLIRLRYRGTCTSCDRAVARGQSAWWEASTRTVVCTQCGAAGPSTCTEAEAEAEPPALDVGVAGGSAQQKYEKLHQRRERELEARWGRLAGVAKFLSDDPRSITVWAQGSKGERILAEHIEAGAGRPGRAPPRP